MYTTVMCSKPSSLQGKHIQNSSHQLLPCAISYLLFFFVSHGTFLKHARATYVIYTVILRRITATALAKESRVIGSLFAEPTPHVSSAFNYPERCYSDHLQLYFKARMVKSTFHAHPPLLITS